MPSDTEVIAAHDDIADEIVDKVVPDSMPAARTDIAIPEDEPDTDVAVPEDEPTAELDRFKRPLLDEEGEELWYAGDKDWEYQYVEFRGDTLAVRKPTKQALSAFSLAASKHVKIKTQNDLTGLFIERHLSEATYDRVFSRMMDPDDPDYNTRSIGELIGKVVKLSTEKGGGLEEIEADESSGDTQN